MEAVTTPDAPSAPPRRGLLDWIEWLGNKLPDPTMLFVLGALLVMLMSWVAAANEWSVQPKAYRQAYTPLLTEAGDPLLHDGEPRVLPQFDADGQPVLELTASQRKAVPIYAPSAESPADGEPAPPEIATDDAGRPIYVERGPLEPLQPVQPVNLLTADGLFLCISTIVDNFMAFPPLGVVLVGMLGIGVAEKTGMLGAALKAFVLIVPRFFLTPTMIFLGIMSSLGMDAGYVVLPPLAAALYISVGRSPLVGVAAVFAGVSAGFNANLLVTGLDPMLAQFSTIGAQVIDPNYVVPPTANWWFMIASTFLVTLTGWFVTAAFVDRRYRRKSAEEGGPRPTRDAGDDLPPGHTFASGFGVFLAFAVFFILAAGPLAWPQSPYYCLQPAYDGLDRLLANAGLTSQIGAWAASWTPWIAPHTSAAPWLNTLFYDPPLWMKLAVLFAVMTLWLPLCINWLARGGMSRAEAAGLGWATMAHSLVLGLIVVLALLPGSPLHGNDPNPPNFARWVAVIVPLIFFAFLAPGIAYGFAVRKLRNGKDLAKMMVDAMAGMAPIIVLAFFAAQFIQYFKFSRLDQMLAMTGGQFLASADMPMLALLAAFVGVTIIFNLFVGSMSAKYAMFAPIFVPMFMLVGISPELTQVAYRIGDSVSNVITPLNAYLVIVLVYIQRFVPSAGMGTLVSMMMPYTVVFAIVWTAFLLVWVQMGWPIGLGGELLYHPAE